MLFYRNLISRKKLFSSILSTLACADESTENVKGLITTFGAERRLDKKFLKAENLAKNWRSLFHPTNECGSRSYVLVGINNFLVITILKLL